MSFSPEPRALEVVGYVLINLPLRPWIFWSHAECVGPARQKPYEKVWKFQMQNNIKAKIESEVTEGEALRSWKEEPRQSMFSYPSFLTSPWIASNRKSRARLTIFSDQNSKSALSPGLRAAPSSQQVHNSEMPLVSSPPAGHFPGLLTPQEPHDLKHPLV